MSGIPAGTAPLTARRRRSIAPTTVSAPSSYRPALTRSSFASSHNPISEAGRLRWPPLRLSRCWRWWVGSWRCAADQECDSLQQLAQAILADAGNRLLRPHQAALTPVLLGPLAADLVNLHDEHHHRMMLAG